MHFQPSGPTLGAEYELQLIDARSLDLADEIDRLLAACPDRRYVTEEYFKPTVEIVSRICRDAAELERHLREQLRMLDRSSADAGLRLVGAGTHPFSQRQVEINPKPRYQEIQAVTGRANFLQVTYGLHVHVGMPSGEEAIRVMNRLRPYLPLLLALSVNSPYWHGLDSGFVSYRQRMLMTLHAFGMPPRIPDWEGFIRLTEAARRAGVFKSYKDMHWDLRPRPDFGTLEIRVMDAQPTVAETGMLAAVCHALVEYLRQAAPGELHLPELPAWIEEENHYRAALHGLQAECLIDADGGVRPMHQLSVRVLDDLTPVAQALAAGDQLDMAREQLRYPGPPAARQHDLRRRTGSLHGVVKALATELERDARRLH